MISGRHDAAEEGNSIKNAGKQREQ
jgi:hypothetical protein